MANRIARRLRKQPTDAELKLWRALNAFEMKHTHFRRQVPIGPYVADFACHSARLVIEVDGGQHNETQGLRADAERTAFLESRGYKVLRFWNPEVLQNVEGVMETILTELRQRMAGSA